MRMHPLRMRRFRHSRSVVLLHSAVSVRADSVPYNSATNMEATERAATSAKQPIAAIDKFYMENTLLRVSGALFCHDPKRAGQSVERIELNRGVDTKSIVIEPHPSLGRPGPLAHKIFVAIIKKHSDYGRPARSEVSFSKRELTRLVGRDTAGGRDNEELTRALQQIHRTFITTNFKNSDGRFIEESFNIFPRVLIARKAAVTDPIDACIVSIAGPIIASLNDEHFTCLNHSLMRELGTIGQALYLRLFFHFKNLYDGHHTGRLKFEKRYDDICREWLGGLTVHHKKSLVEREQLGRHLRQLIQSGFLASYAIEAVANSEPGSQHGFKLVFRPGRTFFADYDRFYRHRSKGDLQFDFHGDQQQIAEPLKVAYRFREKLTGQPLSDVGYVSSKDVETAKTILLTVPFNEIDNFLDYALAEARKTNFDVQTLGGLRQYLTGYIQAKSARTAARTATERKLREDKEEAARRAYERFWSTTADVLLATLPEQERVEIERLAGAEARPSTIKPGPLADTLRGMALRRIAVSRHPGRIPSFEDWRQNDTG